MISLARLLAVPLMVYLILNGYHGAAFWLFVAASVSDAVDGFLAKRFDLASEVGAYLDPLADKVLLVSVYVTMGYVGQVAVWLVILVVFRDLLIIGGAILFHTLTQSLKMEPLYISKVNTVAQFILAAVVLGELGLGVEVPVISRALAFVVAGTTLVSGAAYVVKWGLMAVTMERDR
jgi:cardiolipin synthase